MHEDNLRDELLQTAGAGPADADQTADGNPPRPHGSIADDILALIADGQTYAEAEINFQKSRLTFAASSGKSVAILVALAAGFVHLALVAVVVGGLLALTPVIGALGAALLVTGVLLAGAAILTALARRKAHELTDAFKDKNG